MQKEIKHICPHCNKELNITVYPLINLQSDADLYEDLFSLNLFKHECPYCKKNIIIQYDMFVVDMYKKYILFLCTSQNINDINTEKLFDSLRDNPDFTDIINELQHTRIVTNLNQLLEKLLIFDYDLNDKVLELLKIGLYSKERLNKDEYNQICFNKLEKDELIFTCFNISNNTTVQPIDIAVNIKYYNLIIDTLKSTPPDFGYFEYIDNLWAENLLKQK